MSSTETDLSRNGSPEPRKRKREANEEDLEINLDAPEPPSKKALRKAKKSKDQPALESKDQQSAKAEKIVGAEHVVPNSGKRSPNGIWIGNLSFTTTKQDLLDFMTGDLDYSLTAEQITRINLPAGRPKFGKFQNKGFAYIDLSDEGALRLALQLSEKLLAGRRVLIKNATSFEGRPKETAKEGSGHPPSKRVFIGNLDFDTSVEDLEQHFGVCGPIQHTQMATFEDSGKCKGYAWIEFENISSGQAAMRGWVEETNHDVVEGMHHSRRRTWLGKIKGRKLRMEFAEDKTIRYNKRFGRNATKTEAANTDPIAEDASHEDESRARTSRSHDARKDRPSRPDRNERTKGRRQRYADDTVKRLTGAIVESQGQKVMFD